MARAKRTDRADARRRYRAQLAADAGVDDDATDGAEDAPVTAPATSAGAGTRSTPRARSTTSGSDPMAAPRPAPAGRVTDAFRQAFRPLTLREDLRLLPRLLRHRSFWLPVLIAFVIAAVIVAFQGRELISQIAATYFLGPAPIGAIFLAGFMAPRASYLIGALVAIIAAGLLVPIASLVPGIVAPGTDTAEITVGIAFAPITGIFFGSAAAWYRRFLYLASPARQAPRRPAPTKGKPVRGR